VSLWATAMSQKHEEKGRFVEYEVDDSSLGRGEVFVNHEYEEERCGWASSPARRLARCPSKR
jgi:hypothetical protein